MSQQHITPHEILQRANALHEQIRDWRRTIHMHPELTYTEVQTARLVNSVLHDLGIEAETGVAKTGVVGHIVGGNGPTIGLRADMDALPIQEDNGTAFDSQRPGLMHACGHDAHTAMLMGAATILKGFADEGRLNGNVRLLFQPSEEAWDSEGKSGAKRMVEEGALDNLDAVFGVHVDPRTVTGTVGTRAGAMMAAADMFDLEIKGFGGHGARPHIANDPILLAAQVIQAVNHVISRRINPLEAGVISICTIHAGVAKNVIPETVKLSGTIRSMTPQIRQQLHEELRRACSIVEPLGGSFELHIDKGYPPTVNDETAVALAFDTLNEMLGEGNAFEKDRIMASEDFSMMLQKAPGCFLRLGVKDPTWDREYPVHTSTFQMDENALPIGAATLAAMAVEWMQTK
ncbi:MAG: M20 metallopeptidase family protein [Candidatus Promineifilaceae bacterium]